ncbi:LysR family transcriptional regulator [Chromobacterium sp. IIBBL 290-4]|uniref:LysR family transcriptional regulator n=1 Tax=Chromobacterium sp. IIBBL 290-4 TaxID=2953890 RepID=UPI0020B6A722|nr:LysR family transcriptional regulator [Chromobacterium sp. IIBBL 290-4]UTH74657.1 LysR family transcriptional regulator [Chromobacterium sp. IIBBL 290-4]
MAISENDFRYIDLNLLVTFLVLMRERSVSRAAECLFIGQPAVSGALARLRVLFDDALLVRTPRGMEPSARALQLERELLPLLEGMQSALFQPAAFDPVKAERVFTLAMPDWVEIWLMPRLLRMLMAEAPGVDIVAKPTDPFAAVDMLEGLEMDVGIATLPAEPSWLRSRTLIEMDFQCAHHPESLRLDGALSLDAYIAHPHLLVSYRGAFQSAIDGLLAEQGLRRRVRYSTQAFGALPSLLGRLPALATVPGVLAEHWRDTLGLRACPVPLAAPRIQLALFWHATRDNDPAQRWLRGLVERAAA